MHGSTSERAGAANTAPQAVPDSVLADGPPLAEPGGWRAWLGLLGGDGAATGGPRLRQRLRQDAVACWQRLEEQGVPLRDVAAQLGLTPRTLRRWEVLCRPASGEVGVLGRPAARLGPDQRQAVRDVLELVGPGLGVPTLRLHFPDLARAALTDLLRGYRTDYRSQHATSPRVLHWQVPGRVWAIDFAALTLHGRRGALPPIAQRYPYLLAVRDLASGYQLAWQPVATTEAAEVEAVLAGLFAVHGAPLALKSDNGPAFREETFQKFLAGVGVFSLFSPPAWPSYNGSIEAAIGSLKTRTEHQAREQGHPGVWTEHDVAVARQRANTGHPRRLNGRTPAWVWEQRRPPEDLERVCFTLTVERQRFLARSERGIALEEQLDHWRGSAVDRNALERALVEHDYLLFTRRRIPLTIRPGKVTRNG